MFYPNDPEQLNDLATFLVEHNKSLPRKFGKLTFVPVHIPRVEIGSNLLIGRISTTLKIFAFFELPDYDDLFFIWANNRLAKKQLFCGTMIEFDLKQRWLCKLSHRVVEVPSRPQIVCIS